MPGKHKRKENAGPPVCTKEELAEGQANREKYKPPISTEPMTNPERQRLENAAQRTRHLIEAAKEVTRELNSAADIREEMRDVYAMIKLDVITSNKGARLVYALQSMLPFVEREQAEKREVMRQVKSLDLYSKGLGNNSPLNKIIEQKKQQKMQEKQEENEQQQYDQVFAGRALEESEELGEEQRERGASYC